jgi:ADP-L-glycero-D-manno-heptose 6-epimerase
MPVQIRFRYQYYTCADPARLRAAGYSKSTTSLEDSISDYVKNYLLDANHLGDDKDSVSIKLI